MIQGQGLYRQLRTLESPQGSRISLDGKHVLNFCSNDYLGLASDPELVEFCMGQLKQTGIGSGASSLVCGRSEAHVELEHKLAEFTRRDAALIFSSGYLANMAILTTFANKKDQLVLQDRLNHASLLDAGQLARARQLRYRHLSLADIRNRLEKHKNKTGLLVTESVFSMDGDIAPLKDIADELNGSSFFFVVDDAHGFGVLGSSGEGALLHADVSQESAPLMMGSLGKALGCAGAFVAGERSMIEFLVQKARPYIYSTALSPALAKTASFALQLAQQAPRRERLKNNIQLFTSEADGAGLPVKPSVTPIQPLVIGSAETSMQASRELLRRDIYITAIRPPTVPENTSRLRITLSAAHEADDIRWLVRALSDVLAEKDFSR